MKTNIGMSPQSMQSRRSGQACDVTHTTSADLRVLHSLIGFHGRSLWDIQGNRVRQNNRVKALERDKILDRNKLEPLHTEVKQLHKLERQKNRDLEALMKLHPLADFITRTDGLGAGGVARLLACIGDFDRFATVSKLWRYLGLHVVDGEAPKRQAGMRADWSHQGRTVCYQLGDAMMKLRRSPYRKVYDQKRIYYLARPRKGPSGCPFRDTPHMKAIRKKDSGTGWKVKTGKRKAIQCIHTVKGKEQSLHVHKAALRVLIKELVKDLWREWRRVRPVPP